MTSVPEAPGVPAVILTREQITDDLTHTMDVHIRIKILTEGGLDFANVRLPSTDYGLEVRSISGRTIHSDGLASPFNGKVSEEVIEKQGGYKTKQKMFTLPVATIGCILEYRYEIWGNTYSTPEWNLQSELFELSVRFGWRAPYLSSSGASVAWNSVLPKGAAIQQARISGMPGILLEIQNVPSLPSEDYMPPSSNAGYHVYFYYTTYKTPAEFWTKKGEEWSRERDQFIGPGPGVRDFVAKLMSVGDSPQLTLRKIYAAVTKLENTEFTRERTEHEDKVQGLKPVMTTDDVLARGRGNSYALTQLFVAMARRLG